jgi:hypothetical protein
MGLGLVNTVVQNDAAQRQADAEAQQADLTAAQTREAARLQAERTQQEAEKEAEELRAERARARAGSTAALGTSGVLLQGSPLKVLEGQAYEDEQDAQSILQQGITDSQSILLNGGWSASNVQSRAAATRKKAAAQSGANLTSTLGNALSNYALF